ncbi:MAG: methyltransferase domain-containing protein [Actinomycetota bacterium]|nr:methyltransferase domain-containing protein [Actinomycetota bacterium]
MLSLEAASPRHPLFAAVYDHLTRPLEREILGPRRAGLLGDLVGEVLEVGAGTGANLRHFRPPARLVASEPDPAMRSRMLAKLPHARVPVELADAAAESLPFADGSFNVVVFTCTLCTVDDVNRALAEARRVLRNDGRLVVLEHVRGKGQLAHWQDRITPLWARVMAGCHPNRDIAKAIRQAGFSFDRIEHFDPFPRWIPTRPMLQALARFA